MKKMMLPSDWQTCGGIFFINDCYVRAQTTVVSTIPGQVFLGGRGEQTEQVRGSKPVAIFLMASASVQFLP